MRYPMGLKVVHNKDVYYGNRGMSLENDLNDTNNYYLIHDIAVIYKKPTPIVINRVDYKSRSDAIIKEARFKIPSTTDYNGIYRGRYIDFEAKETKNKTSFPLSNIHKHQLEHLRSIIKHGGIAFIIVRFISFNETYYVSAEDLFFFLDNTSRKSIPYDFFKEKGHLIIDRYNPRVDYISIVDNLYFKEAL
jgi:recombination protein U